MMLFLFNSWIETEKLERERKEELKHVVHLKGWKQWRNRSTPAKGGSVIILLKKKLKKISIYLHSDVRHLTIILSELQGSYQCEKDVIVTIPQEKNYT